MTVSPDAIRLTELVEIFPERAELAGFLGFDQRLDGEINLGLCHVAFVGIFVLAGRLDHHRGIHDTD